MSPIVCICGTSRPGNYTRHALAVVRDTYVAQGQPVQWFDAAELQLAFPGQPPTVDAARLKEAVASARGVILATPEYHGSYAAMTKLIIENMGFPSALAGQAVGLLGVAAGRIGAIKSLEHLRGVCSHTGGVVMPQTVSIAAVRKAFAEDGTPTDADTEQALRQFAERFATFSGTYEAGKVAFEEVVRGDAGPWVASA